MRSFRRTTSSSRQHRRPELGSPPFPPPSSTEKLQVNVALYWLTDIANCHKADGRPDQASAVLRRALTHLAADRGDEAADASALNEQLIEALALAGRPGEAVEAAEAALEARRKLFGAGVLVVAQSEMRVAQVRVDESGWRGERGVGD